MFQRPIRVLLEKAGKGELTGEKVIPATQVVKLRDEG
jgi:hypothetical protein